LEKSFWPLFLYLSVYKVQFIMYTLFSCILVVYLCTVLLTVRHRMIGTIYVQCMTKVSLIIIWFYDYKTFTSFIKCTSQYWCAIWNYYNFFL